MQSARLGPFELEYPLQTGGMGEVWRGHHVAVDTPVAIKVLTAEIARKPGYVEAFRRETEAVAALDHPGIVRVYDYGTIDREAADVCETLVEGSPYFVMELAECSLAEDAPILNYGDLRDVAVGLMSALGHAHSRGLVHRDIKPANLLMLSMENHRTGPGLPGLVLSDFGIAHEARDGDAPTVDASCGTPGYMAPEQFYGAWRDFGPWTDLYAAGCLIWRFATGKRPFLGSNARSLFNDHVKTQPPHFDPRFPVPPALEGWLRTLLRKEPASRFQRAADAIWALNLLGEPAAAPRRVHFAVMDVDTDTVPKMPEGFSQLDETQRMLPPPSPVPVAPDWRSAHEAPAGNLLSGAGLGLFGLRAIPLVGREAERDQLWAALRAVAEERTPRAVVLGGPAGCGKSRLAEWLTSRADELGAAFVLRARHDRNPGPVHGLSPMVARFLRCQGQSRQGRRSRLSKALPRLGMHNRKDLDALAELAGPDETGGPAQSFRFRSPAERFATLGRLFSVLGRVRPIIVVIEDGQWGLEGLDLVLNQLAEARRETPVLFVITARDEALVEAPASRRLIDEIGQRPAAQSLTIGPLGAQDRIGLVRGILGLEPALAARIEERTAGNALFALELVGDWIRRGLLVPGVDGFQLVDGAEVELPDDLHAVWSTRVDTLLAERGEASRVALELAAALGQDVDAQEWAAVCRAAGLSAATTLISRMFSERLAIPHPEGDGWSFVHGMLRESILRRAEESFRASALHRLCATMLEERPGSASRSERLGRHLVLAAEHALALRHLADGAKQRLDAGDNRHAEVLLEEWAAAVDAAAVPALHPALGDGAISQIRLLRMRGQFAEAELQAERLHDRAERNAWAHVLPAILHERGRVAWQLGQPELAARWLREAAEGAALMADRRLEADCKRVMGLVLLHRGLGDKATGFFDAALGEYEQLQDTVWAAACQMNKGVASRQSGDTTAARGLVQDARARFVAAGCRWGEAECENELGELSRVAKDFVAAEAHYRAALELNRWLGSGDAVFNEVNLGLVLSHEGRWTAARQAIKGALDTFEAQGRRAFVGLSHALMLPCSAGQRAWSQWDEHLWEAQMLLRQTGFVDFDIANELERAATLARDAGEGDRARRAFEAARAQWHGLGRADDEARVRTAISRLK